MRNFVRAIRLALRYRWTLFLLVLSSATVALLWGGNLGAVYPIVDVVLKRQSLVQWVDNNLSRSQAACAQLRAEMAKLDKQVKKAQTGELRELQRALESKRARLEAERSAERTARKLQPWIHRFLPQDAFSTLVLVLGVVLASTFIKSIFLVISAITVERVAQLVTFDLRKELYRRTLHMNLAHFGEDRTATLLSHFTHDVEGVTAGIRTVFGRAVREPLKIAACLFGAAWISWRLLLFSLVVTPVAIFLINRLAASVKRANRRAMTEMAQLYNRLAESLGGVPIVKAYTMERFERRRFHEQSKEYFHKAMRIAVYNSLSRPCIELMSIGVVCMAVLAGGYLVLYQETHVLGIKLCNRPLSIPSLMTFFALLAGVSDPFRKLADVYNQIQRGSAAADRIYTLVDRRPFISSPKQPRALPEPLSEIVLDRVSFAYYPDQSILQQVDLRILAGETIAIVGPNGCGKSSLINLIPRFYDPLEGSIRWNDCDLRDLRLGDLRRRIGLVPQQTILFDDTVANNIRYGSPHAHDDQVMAAAKRAHAHEFISRALIDGYDTVVGTGGKLLSGGQRQRIALARAILRDPEVLVLDEATSQIDVESEQLIQQALEEISRHRTTIVITHRIETLAMADRIVVMEEGRIVDVGTHHQLLARCVTYQRLHHADFRIVA